MGSSGETTQPGKCLPGKHESLSLISRTPMEVTGEDCKPRSGEAETGSPGDLQQASPEPGRFQPVRGPIHKPKQMGDSQGQGSPLASAHPSPEPWALIGHIVVDINMTNKTKQITTYKHDL